MTTLSLDWARDVARILVLRGITDSGSERSADVKRLLEILSATPAPGSWTSVLRQWKGTAAAKSSARAQQLRRLRELLARASAGLNTEQLLGRAPFRARVRCSSEITLATLLLNAGARESALEMARHTVSLAAAYQATDMEIQALLLQRRIEAAQVGADRVAAITMRIQDLLARMQAELHADALEDEFRNLLPTRLWNRPTTRPAMQRITESIRDLAKESDSWHVALTHYRIALWHASRLDRPSDMVRIGTAAVRWLDAHPRMESIAHRVEFEGSRLSAYLMLKDFQGASKAWQTLQRSVTVGDGNWISLLQLYFLVCVTTKHYTAARDALHLYETKRQRGGPAWRTQQWHMYRAFVLLLIDEGMVEPGPYAGAPRIYAGTLQSTCKDLVAGKPHANAAIQILKVFQWLRARRYSELVNAVGALRSYADRHLNDDQTARTFMFFRMLATIVAADFDADEARKRGNAVWMRHPIAHTLIRDDVEIIPYDDLWEMALRILSGNTHPG